MPARLIADPEVSIQEQALNLLRNLVCGKEADIEAVFNGLGESKLMNILESKLGYSQASIISQVRDESCVSHGISRSTKDNWLIFLPIDPVYSRKYLHG